MQVETQVSVATSHREKSPQVVVPVTHVSPSSSQVSSPVQSTPSEQSRAEPPQVPPEQTSSTVQNNPSLHDAPSLSVQAVAETVVSHLTHGS